MTPQPRALVAAIVVDSHDPTALANFWWSLLGGEVVEFREFGVVALRAPGVTFDFVHSVDTKVTKNRWHLDVATADPDRTIALAVALGGTIASVQGRPDRFTVMHDIEGNEFCVLNTSIRGPWVPPEDPPT